MQPYWISKIDKLSKYSKEDKENAVFDVSSLNYIHLPAISNFNSNDLKELILAVNIHLQYYFFCYKYNGYLQIEHDKYYIPFVKSRTLSYSMDPDNLKKKPNNACDFLESIKYIYIKAMNKIDLNEDVSMIINCIKRYFFTIIKFLKTKDFEIMKIAYNVVIILVNLDKKEMEDGADKNVIIRILNVIISEINMYKSKYCNVTIDNLLTLDDSPFKDQNEEYVNSIINNFFHSNIENFTFNPYNDDLFLNTDYNFFNLNFIYDTYIKNSFFFKNYGDLINVYWKGNIQTIKNIYLDNTNDIISHASLYSRYDLYIKFHVAVFYYEILVCQQIKPPKERCYINIQHYFTDFATYEFPEILAAVVLNISWYLNNCITMESNPNVSKKLLEDTVIFKNNIVNKFQEFNIVFSEKRKSVLISKKKYMCSILLKIFKKPDDGNTSIKKFNEFLQRFNTIMKIKVFSMDDI